MAVLLRLGGSVGAATKSLCHIGMRMPLKKPLMKEAGSVGSTGPQSSSGLAFFCSSCTTRINNNTALQSLRPLLSKYTSSLRTVRRKIHDRGDWRDIQLHQTPEVMAKSVPKDVLVFNHPNDLHMRMVSMGTLCMFLFMASSARDVYSCFGKAVSEKEMKRIQEGTSWYAQVLRVQYNYRVVISGLCLLLGGAFLAYGFITPRRSISQLYLLRGAKAVRFVTYKYWSKTTSFEVPVEHISCRFSRSAPAKTLAVQVKGRRMLFQIDKEKGKFLDPVLFDQVIGLKRGI